MIPTSSASYFGFYFDDRFPLQDQSRKSVLIVAADETEAMIKFVQWLSTSKNLSFVSLSYHGPALV